MNSGKKFSRESAMGKFSAKTFVQSFSKEQSSTDVSRLKKSRNDWYSSQKIRIIDNLINREKFFLGVFGLIVAKAMCDLG